MSNISSVGVHQAIRRLLPPMVLAGRNALLIQDAIIQNEARVVDDKLLGNAFANALTDADLLVEDLVGSAVAALFSDASFYGEEHERDRISHYIPAGRPYLVTLDPINGTVYFANGQSCFEIVLTICDATGVVGSVVYQPRYGMAYYACCKVAYRINANAALQVSDPTKKFHIAPHAPPIVLVSGSMSQHRDALGKMGYRVVCPRHEYVEKVPRPPEWDLCPAGILEGRVCGVVLGSDACDLIDNVAIAEVAMASGASVLIDSLDMQAKKAKRIVMATTPKIYHDILRVIDI